MLDGRPESAGAGSENVPLDVIDVAVVYPDGFRALDGVNLRLGHGEIVALLGASGSGKTTLLRAIEGLEPLERGRIIMGGQDVTTWPTHRRPCTMVFQDGQLFPHRTVGANVAYALEGRGRSRARKEEVKAAVSELLELVGLAGFAERSITTLSGGQAQRVALARSLARRTGLVLFDEPLSALDTQLRVGLGNDLRRVLQQTGTAALYVTHDGEEAARVADRVVHIEDLTNS